MIVMNPRKKYTLVAAISATMLILLHFHDGTKAALSDYYYRAKPADGSLQHLILVPCHAIWKPDSDVFSPIDSKSWWLGNDQHRDSSTFVSHIERAVTLLNRDPAAVLVFSGGQTQLRAGEIGEGQSYLMLAEHLYKGATHLTKGSQTALDALQTRATSEDYARDSYENLLYSIARFNEFTGKYPQQITIVGYKFKQARFLNLHTTAVHYPPDRVRYIGIDGPDIDPKAAAEGELVHAYEPFMNDPYGCSDQQLVRKRIARNPFHRQPPYAASCPELAPFFNVCADPDSIPPSYKVKGYPVEVLRNVPEVHDHEIHMDYLEDEHVQGHSKHGRKGHKYFAEGGVGDADHMAHHHPSIDHDESSHDNEQTHDQGVRKQRLQLERKLENHEFP